MTTEAWMYVKPAAWDALDPMSLSNEARRMYTGAITGFWGQFTGGFTVYNVIGSVDAINEIVALLAPADVHATYAWVQGPGYDNLDVYPTVPADVLAVMKDNKTYDEDGNELTSIPATFELPNWGHWFLGQSERIFAGKFNDRFSEVFL